MTGQNPSPREVFDDLAAEHLNQPTGRRRSMFGRDCLTTGGAMVAFFHRDHLALKLPPDRAAAMITSREGVTPEMGDRAMRRWLAVPLPEGPNAHQRWRQLLADASAHAGGTDKQLGASPEERFAALVDVFTGQPGVTGPDDGGRRGFGSSALRVHGSIFAMLTRGQLVVKLPAGRVTALIADGHGGPFHAGKGRPMKQWLAVTTTDHDAWHRLAREALEFVGSQRR